MDVVETGMSVLNTVGSTLKSNAAKMASATYADITAKSLSQYSTELQLRPTIAIEKEIQNDDKMGVLVHTAVSNFAGYYIVALSIDNTVNGVSVGRLVGKYSPTRDASAEIAKFGFDTMVKVSNSSYVPKITHAIEGTSLSHEKAHLRVDLDFPKLKPEVSQGIPVISTESGFVSWLQDGFSQYFGNDLKEAKENIEKREKNIAELKDTVGGNTETPALYNQDNDKDIRKDINTLQNLAVGRLLNVSLSRDKATASVNLLLKPTLLGLKSRSLIAIAGMSKQPKSFSERWSAYWDRATINSFWDLLTYRDLIKARERNLVEDTTGYYEKVLQRNRSNKTAALLTGEFSVGTVANTWIISDTTATRIETAIGARLQKNKRARDKFMEESGVMTLIVYNPDYQRVFIYNHGLDDVSEISMNYLEKKVNDKNFDMDVFKLLSQGSAPIL